RCHYLLSMLPPHPRPTHFPYTTLFRSIVAVAEIGVLLKCFNERPLAEDVHAHIDESQFRIGLQRTRRYGLLFEFDGPAVWIRFRSEEHTSELQSRFDLVCRLLLEKKK